MLFIKSAFTFASSSKTETSSSGEQLVRDTLDVRKKCQSKRTIMVSFAIYYVAHFLSFKSAK
ncbi:MAG: hypothetical protein A2033_09245 [Bacteroidetes bacterium GWA2_31_9]|nr:MAG: hypothetical protein A2033_09245 [Bacteroidetes bacterium GWA2_31_9]